MSEAHEDTSKPTPPADEPKLEAAETPKVDAQATGDAESPKAESAAPEHVQDGPKSESVKDEGEAAVGTSLAPADAPSGIDPFLAKASEPPAPAAPRPFYAKALDYSAHAAMIVGLIGFAWTVSDHVTTRKPASTGTPVNAADAAAATATPTAKPVDDLGDLRRTNQKMAVEIRNLHASLEALRTTVVRERSSGDDVRSLSATVDQVKTGLAAARSEQSAQIAQLTGKFDKLQREAHQQMAERSARIETRAAEPKPERRETDTTATASIPAPAAKAVPTPPTKPTVLASVAPETRADQARRDDPTRDDGKPPVISGWVVRDVYQGVALIEGRRGSMEVVPGVSIPGAGVVKSIDRHGGGWTVTTSKGQLAFAAQQQRETQHEPRRNGYRDYYGPRGYDY